MTKKKKPKNQLLKQISFYDVIQGNQIYPSRFGSTAKRIKVFMQIGHTCVRCNRTATTMKKYKDLSQDRIFWSICSDDNVEITIDHILPKSLGGKNVIDNFQPMCEKCNSKKGNGLNLFPWNESICVPGNEVWLKKVTGNNRRRKKKFEFKGIIEKIDLNPYSGKIEVFVVSERGSCYRMSSKLYIGIGNFRNNV